MTIFVFCSLKNLLGENAVKLREIDFGRIHLASGAGGFKCDGSEYWYHRSGLSFLRPDFTGATKTTKTATLMQRTTKSGANMDLDENLRPKEFLPRSIAINPLLCCSVNAVGLSGPGLKPLLDMGIWQEWREPFFISVMAIGETMSERLLQWEQIVKILVEYKSGFKAPFALQENYSCPSTGHDLSHIYETEKMLDMGAEIGVSQVPKFNVLQVSKEAAIRLNNHSQCDALLFSNTMLWKDLPLWVRLVSFGTPFSPLRWRGIKQDGGYSGPYLRKLVLQKVYELRRCGFTKPIIACGGITKPSHVVDLRNAGADAVEIGTVAMCRAWRVKKIIDQANNLHWR